MILVACPSPALQRRMVFAKIIPNSVNRAFEVEQLASGKGVNCVRAAMGLGHEALNLLLLGGDSGVWMKKAMDAERMLSRVVEVSAATRICNTLYERETAAVTELVENAAEVEVEAVERFIAAFRDELIRCKVVVAIGTIPRGMPVTLYRELVRIAAEAKVPSIVDAQGAVLLSSLEEKPFLVKPNRVELEAATGIECRTKKGVAEAVSQLHERGAKWVLITDGSAPALLSHFGEQWFFYPPKIDALNPVGSGDSLTGGLAGALSAGKSVADAVRVGIACGAANAEGKGYGRIEGKEVERLVGEVRVEKL